MECGTAEKAKMKVLSVNPSSHSHQLHVISKNSNARPEMSLYSALLKASSVTAAWTVLCEKTRATLGVTPSSVGDICAKMTIRVSNGTRFATASGIVTMEMMNRIAACSLQQI